MVSINWGRQGSKKKEKEAKKKASVLDKLRSMDMVELREFVKINNLEAKDTRRAELIDEIIAELKERGEI